MTTKLGVVLRHVRGQAGEPASDERPDGALLRAFVTREDQTAFGTVVRRHGAMVLRVCRRVLENAHDAEEAFQATFLVLARRSTALGEHESVAGWLHGVAYRMAINARRASARRQKHERQASTGQSPDPALQAAVRELQTVLDEEIGRLPEILRAAFVLCCLEQRSGAEAAKQLGVREATVWTRISRARKLLHQRLARRGVSLTAVLAAVTLSADAALAVVPPPLLGATVKAATHAVVSKSLESGLVSPTVAALVRGADGMKRFTKTKTAIALVVTAVLGASFGLAALPGAGALPVPEAKLTDTAESHAPGDKEQPNAPDVLREEPVTLTGVVLDTEGKKLADVPVAVVSRVVTPFRGQLGPSRLEEVAQTRSDAGGRFRLDVPAAAMTRSHELSIVATAPGHGLSWEWVPLAETRWEFTLRLPVEKVIQGRLIDLQAQPAKKVKLFVSQVAAAAKNRICLPTSPLAEYPEKLACWPESITTDDDGRFSLRGFGKDTAVTLVVASDRFAHQTVVVSASGAGKPDAPTDFEAVLLPPQILEGKVLGEDTGKPIGKVLLRLYGRTPAGDSSQTISAWTDEQGRFRVHGPPGDLSVNAYPADGSPYLVRFQYLEWPKGAVRHEVTMKLPRGLLVRGKVTEAGSGKPQAGATVWYKPLDNNPNAGYGIDSWFRTTDSFARTASDGTFLTTVLPGRGHVLTESPSRDYIWRPVDTGQLATGQSGGHPIYVQAVTPLDLKPSTEEQELAIKLRRGVTVTGTILSADGKPAKKVLLLHPKSFPVPHPISYRVGQVFPWRYDYSVKAQVVTGGRFTLPGCDPDEVLPVFFLDQALDQGAHLKVSAKDAKGEVKVQLAACGSLKMGIVNQGGQLLPGYHISGPDLIWGANRFDTLSSGNLNQSWGFFADAESRVTIPLIPGATYRVDGAKGKEFTAESGKTIELSDVVINTGK
jgi:RNA polymerase sigma factor (sigma-70 family)